MVQHAYTVYAKKHPNGDIDIHKTADIRDRWCTFPAARSNTPKKNQKQVTINGIKYNLGWLEESDTHPTLSPVFFALDN